MSDIEMYRGDNEKFFLTITRNMAPVDLTGGKIWMTARRSPGSTPVFTRTSDPDDGIVITNALGGLATVTMTSADTSGLASEVVSLIYDVQVMELGGRVSTAFAGTLLVRPDTTT